MGSPFSLVRFNRPADVWITDVGGFDLDWGIWDLVPTNPITKNDHTSNFDLGGTSEIQEGPVLLISALPLANLTGTRRFESGDDYLIRITGQSDNTVNSVSGDFGVDFGSGQIVDGQLEVCSGGDCSSIDTGRWFFNFGGSLVGGVHLENSSSASSASNTFIHGYHQGYFIGNSSTPGFVLTFSYDRFLNSSVSEVSNPDADGDASLIGSVLFGDTGQSNPFVLSTSERQSLTRRGFGVFNVSDSGAAGSDSIIQGAASSGTSPIVTSTASSSTLASAWPFFSFNVLQRNNASEFFSEQPDPDFDLFWGLWDGDGSSDALLSPDSYDSSVTPSDEAGQIVFATFTPTPIAQLVGSRVFNGDDLMLANYEDPLGASTPTAVEGGFDINFDTGTMNNLQFKVCFGVGLCSSPTEYWFTYEKDDIQVVNGQVDQVDLTGQHVVVSTSTDAFTGSLSGSFIGDGAPEGFTAGFRLVDASGSVLGGALLFKDTQLLTLSEFDDLNNSGKFGAVVFPNQYYPEHLLGLATDGSTGSPLFGMNNWYYYGGFTSPLSDGEDYLAVRRNNSTLTNFQTDVGGFDMDWGFWVSSSEDSSPLLILGEDNLLSQSTIENAEFGAWWISATPADIADLTGTKRFFDTSEYQFITHDGQPVSEFSGFFEIDFGEGVINDSSFKICVGGTDCDNANAIWTASIVSDDIDDQLLHTTVSGSYLDLTQSEPLPAGFTGIFDGIFVGSSGNAFGAALSFGGEGGELGSSGPYVAGVALFQTDNLASSEFSSLNNRIGFTLFDPNENVINGETSSVTGSEFLIAQTDPSTPRNFNFADFTRAMKGSLGSGDVTIQSQSVGGFDLTFGHWADKANTQLFDTGGFDPNAGADYTIFASGTPASLSILNGSAHFEMSSEYLIADENGIVTPTSVTGEFDIDLTSGFFISDSFQFSVCFNDSEGCEEEWSADSSSLNGAQLVDGVLQDDAVTGLISGWGVSASTFGGSWNGFVVGDTVGERGFAAGFLFEDDVDSTNFLKGAALFDEVVNPVLVSESEFNGFGFALLADVSTGISADGRLSFLGNSRTDWGCCSPQGTDVISFDGGTIDLTTLFSTDPDHYLDIGANSGQAFFNQFPGPFDAMWEGWNSSGQARKLFDDLTNENNYTDVAPYDTIVFSTHMDNVIDVSALSGTATLSTFESGNEKAGFSSNAGWIISGVEAIFDIDLGSGLITNGSLTVTESGEGITTDWVVGFGGLIQTLVNSGDPTHSVAYFDFNQGSFTSSAIYDDGVNRGVTIDGDLVGILMDDDGSVGLVGGFNLQANGDPSNFVIGTYTMTDYFTHMTSKELTGLESGITNGMFVSGSPASSHHFSEIYGGPVHETGTASDPIFVARQFASSTFGNEFDYGSESILRSSTTKSAVAGSNGVSTWGHWGIPPGSGNPNDETFSRLSFDSGSGGSLFDGTGGHDAYWFIADPSTATLPSTGTYRYDSIVNLQGTYSTSATGGSGVPTFGAIDESNGSTVFTFDIDFGTGNIDNGSFTLFSGNVDWSADFTGTLEDSSGSIAAGGTGPFININDFTSTVFNINSSPVSFTGGTTGEIQGYFTGNQTAGGAEGIGLAFNLLGSDALTTQYSMYGTILLNGNGSEVMLLSTPETTVEEYAVDWGQWNNPVEDNWVVVNPAENGQVELQTSNHLAMIDPTPVANLTGTGSYGTTIASDFVGSGSAGDVTQVVAGMDVDFNTGVISNGSLQVEVAGSQAWEIDFAGSVNGGMVDLNSLGGTLSDPGGIISNQIDANLGGVFTGTNAEAFVGGFDMIDQINELNYVDGLYTIER